jgi:hypothetical protein
MSALSFEHRQTLKIMSGDVEIERVDVVIIDVPTFEKLREDSAAIARKEVAEKTLRDLLYITKRTDIPGWLIMNRTKNLLAEWELAQ